MNRREFCQHISATAGAIALTPILNACSQRSTPMMTPGSLGTPEGSASQASPIATTEATILPTTTATHAPQTPAEATIEPTPTATLLPTVESDGAKVALIRTSDRADGVRQALDLLDFNPVSGRPVLFKPNFNSADPAPGSTDNELLRVLTESLWNMGADSITLCDRSGMGHTRQVMQQKGVYELAKELGFDVQALDELGSKDWVIRHSNDFHWAKGIAVPRLLLETECVVQTCNLKTHQYGGHFTMSLKNSVGFVAKTAGNGHDFMQELHNSVYQRQMIAEVNALYSPALIVMDGVEAFVDGGPARGKIARSEVILAGTDPIAVDAVGVAILRLFGATREVMEQKIFQQDQIARAVELDLGVGRPEDIQFITQDGESKAYAEQIRQVLLA